MSWMDLDDRLLDHPKFIRAQKRGGGDSVWLWLGLRQYVAQHLTDGFIPADMLDEVRGPEGKRRAAALQVLKDVGLVEEAPGGVALHDYLHWSKSRDTIVAQRDAARLRQAKSRAKGTRESQQTVTRDMQRDSHETSPLVTEPSPLLSTPLQPNTTDSSAYQVGTEPIENRSRATPCPPDLPERLVKNGVHLALAQHLKCDPDSVIAELNAFRDTWVIGKLAGQSRSHWAGKAREWVINQHKQGLLKPPGELEHEQHKPAKKPRNGGTSSLAEVISAPYHETYQLPDYLKD